MLGVTSDADVVILELQRPDSRNALDLDQCRRLHKSLDEAVQAGARAIVISGQGPVFCSGADLGGVYGEEFLVALYGMLHHVSEVPVPVIAAVNGPAIGAGTQLAIACDLRVVDATATFAVPTAQNAMAVDGWTVRRLMELAGAGRAGRLMLAAGSIDRDEAIACGLADRAGTLGDTIAWAHEIAALAPLSVAHSKLILRGAPEDVVGNSFQQVWASDDVREAARARAEKRAPRFRGR